MKSFFMFLVLIAVGLGFLKIVSLISHLTSFMLTMFVWTTGIIIAGIAIYYFLSGDQGEE